MTKYLVMLSLCISVSGCMTTPALPDAERPQHWGQSMQPEHNFYQISETLFRSEQPDQDLVPSLKAQKIDVINLSSMKYFSFLASFGKLAYLDLSNKPL